MKILIKEKLSPHKFKTPEGYLICQDAILARTGKQTYRKNELFLDTDDNSEIEVDRPEEEVFANETLASFENKPVTIEHPDEDVTIDNYKDYSVGFARDIRRGKVGDEDVILGNLVITDKDAIDKIESGEMVELSCGYDCDIVGDDAPKQTHIRGNHIALCEQGRAGIAKIVDSVKDSDYDEYVDFLYLNTTYDKQKIFEIAKKYFNKGLTKYEALDKIRSNAKDSVKDSELQQYGNLKKGEVYKGTNKFAVANEYWQIQRIWEENGKVLVSYRQYYRLKENIKDEGERVNTYELVWNTMKSCEKLNPSTWRNDEINMYRKSIAKDSIHDYYSSLTPSDREEVYALAQKRGWSLSYEDMVDIYRKHKNGTQKDKEKAELLLEECNYHDELRMLRNKDYDKYKRASGITDSIHDSTYVVAIESPTNEDLWYSVELHKPTSDWSKVTKFKTYEEADKLRRNIGGYSSVAKLDSVQDSNMKFKLDKKTNDYGEYVIQCFKNGQYNEAGSSYTDDWEDAVGTLNAIARQFGLNVRQQGRGYVADSISSDVNVGDTIVHSLLSNESDADKFKVVKVDDSMIYARHLDTNETYTIDKNQLNNRGWSVMKDSDKLFKVNGTYVSANNMVDAIKKHRDSKVKDSTPVNIKARLVWTENGHLKHKEISHDELERLGRGNRRTADYEGKTGGILPRRELWNQPTLKGFLGPMYDGDAIRYESQSANDILSI